MGNLIRSHSGSTSARTDYNSLNGRQVSPAASARSGQSGGRSGVSVHSHPQSHKSMNTQASGQHQGCNQGQYQGPNSPQLSVYCRGQSAVQGPVTTVQNFNQSQGLNSPSISGSSGNNTARGGSHQGQDNNQYQLKDSPATSLRSSTQFTVQAQGDPAETQSLNHKQLSSKGNNSGQLQNQVKSLISGPRQGSRQFPKSTDLQKAGSAHDQPEGKKSIHSRGQQGGQHQRQTSTSHMNPAVPAFESNYQVAQLIQPNQPTMFSPGFPHIPLPVHESMMADSQEGHNKLNELVKKIKEARSLDLSQERKLIEKAQSLGQEYDQECTHLKTLYNQACFESQTNQRYLANTTENLRQAYLDRDRLGVDRDAIQAANNKLRQEAEIYKRKNDVEKDWNKVKRKFERDLAQKDAEIERQRAQIEQQRRQIDQQLATIEKQQLELDHIHARDVKFLDGAQIMWMGQNPPASIKSTKTSEHNPLTSPSVASSATYNVSGMSGLGSSHTTPHKGLAGQSFSQASPSGFNQSKSGPSKERRRPNLPIQKPIRGRTDVPDLPWEAESSRAYNTEPGDTPLAGSQSRSTALVLSSVGAEDPSLFYQNELAGLYQLIEGWAMAYCTTPKISNDQAIARTNQTLWAFMMNCTYPGQRQDAHTHLTTLLNNAKSRPWFMVRMGVTYIVKEMLSVTSYKNFSPQVDAELSDVQAQLDAGGLPNNTRSALIDRRAKAIQSAVGGPHWETYRGEQLVNHSKELRDILGPMLDDSADRSKAGKDLGFIALKAWDLSEHMNTAQVTFVVNFPDPTTDKFNASTMISRNHTSSNPMALQLSHARLMLAITPVITMRDDRGMTIKAKNLHYATVLTMA